MTGKVAVVLARSAIQKLIEEFSGIVVDAEGMERKISARELDRAIVRPPQLADKAYTGSYRIREEHLPRFGFNISRAGVTDCLIKILNDRTTVKKILGANN
jgi:hypothetical protein